MNLLEKLPVALSGLCLATLCNSPALAQEVDLPDGVGDGPPPMEGMVEVTLDGDGEPEFTIAMDPNAIQMAAPGGPGGPPRMMMMRRGWGGRGGGMRCGGGGCPMLGALDLSDDQYEKFYALKNSFLDKVGPKMLEIRTHERHLKDLMTQTSVDAKAARNLQDKINGLKADVANMKLDNRLAMHDVLNEEQRKKIRDWVIKGGRGMHHRGGPRLKMEKKDS
ncbi:MAG TPA: periplasmic heavy metal sensor [Candidatus Melainabacteria bacterium]|jgi:Spy/CpxP family protein refolding chaperone|nr:periplasmic heavy metal sensor [Candidatus Melainabacteria bacterium]HIN64984.1 periplasmic heavy metal sensor [Candidatus Obscuribacterales bacterium]